MHMHMWPHTHAPTPRHVPSATLPHAYACSYKMQLREAVDKELLGAEEEAATPAPEPEPEPEPEPS